MLKRIHDLSNKLHIMEQYLELKVSERDWHAVWDAAIDIQGLEEQLAIYKDMCDEPRS